MSTVRIVGTLNYRDKANETVYSITEMEAAKAINLKRFKQIPSFFGKTQNHLATLIESRQHY